MSRWKTVLCHKTRVSDRINTYRMSVVEGVKKPVLIGEQRRSLGIEVLAEREAETVRLTRIIDD